jgi:protein O-mannosyl-transferase
LLSKAQKNQITIGSTVKDSRAKMVICIFLMVATFCIYFQVQGHAFISWDDAIYCCLQKYTAGFTIENFKWAFTTFDGGFWFPLTLLSHLLDFELYGFYPKGHHLTNLFFHIANSLLLFLILYRMTKAIWQSAFVAAMFALHPLSVESVAWASERKNVLSTLFWLLTIWSYIHYSKKLTIKSYILVFLFFSLGLMSKSMLVTLPFTLLLLDYWPLRRLKFPQEKDGNKILKKNSTKRTEILLLVLEKIPLFFLTCSFSILTIIAQKTFRDRGNYTELLPFPERLMNSIVSYMEYLKKMIWPENLAFFYPYPFDNVLEGILCCITLIGITIISIKFIRKAPYFAVGWLWYLGTFVPVIGIVPPGGGWPGSVTADRYAYIPLIGIFIIIAWGIPEIISKWRYKEKILSVSAGIVILGLMITTQEQVRYWKNTITIFKHTLQVTDKKYPNLAIVHNNLGIALFTDGKIEEAISQYKTAIKLKPDLIKPYYNLGIALFNYHKIEEAISQYKMAIKLNPNHSYAHYNLGLVLLHQGDLKGAIFHFKETLRITPDLNNTLYYLEIAKRRLRQLN